MKQFLFSQPNGKIYSYLDSSNLFDSRIVQFARAHTNHVMFVHFVRIDFKMFYIQCKRRNANFVWLKMVKLFSICITKWKLTNMDVVGKRFVVYKTEKCFKTEWESTSQQRLKSYSYRKTKKMQMHLDWTVKRRKSSCIVTVKTV